MASKLKIGKLMLLLASTAMAGAIQSEVQAQDKIDCDSGLTQIAIASQQGGEGGLDPRYEACVGGAQQNLPLQEEFVGTAERETRAQRGWEHAWPDQSYVQD